MEVVFVQAGVQGARDKSQSQQGWSVRLMLESGKPMEIILKDEVVQLKHVEDPRSASFMNGAGLIPYTLSLVPYMLSLYTLIIQITSHRLIIFIILLLVICRFLGYSIINR